MYNWDFSVGVGLTISNDTQTASLDTAAFDANMDKLIALGYREFKLSVPGCSGGSSCGFRSAGSAVDPNSTWTFANSTGYNSSTGRGWYGNCEGSLGCVGGLRFSICRAVRLANPKSITISVPTTRSAAATSRRTSRSTARPRRAAIGRITMMWQLPTSPPPTLQAA